MRLLVLALSGWAAAPPMVGADPDDHVSVHAFLVTGDPQYLAEKSEAPTRLDRFSAEANDRFIAIVNALPGETIPAEMGGGSVSRAILGVVVNGDLIDSADKTGGPYPAMQKFEWARYDADYGLDGTDGRLRFPVYELHGNHDGPQGDTFVIDSIIERNRRRPGIRGMSPNGMHYSWDWGPLHLVALGIFVGDGDARRDGHHYAPRQSLAFLRADLEERVGDSGRPVALFFHLHPFGPEFDWPAEDLSQLWAIVERFNVVALFHGHTHGSPPAMVRWDGSSFAPSLETGVPVFNPDDSGAAKSDPEKPGEGLGLNHGFLYVEVVDRSGDEGDSLHVRACATRDNWKSRRWSDQWEIPIRIPSAQAR